MTRIMTLEEILQGAYVHLRRRTDWTQYTTHDNAGQQALRSSEEEVIFAVQEDLVTFLTGSLEDDEVSHAAVRLAGAINHQMLSHALTRLNNLHNYGASPPISGGHDLALRQAQLVPHQIVGSTVRFPLPAVTIEHEGRSATLGPFWFTIERSGNYFLEADESNCRMGYCHPHAAQRGSICMGDHGTFLKSLLSAGEIVSFLDHMLIMLGHYNVNSPYVCIEQWMGPQCPSCLETAEDEATCRHCGRIFCEECMTDRTCEFCSVRCPDCDRLFPRALVRRSSRSGDTIRRCRDCHRAIIQSREELSSATNS